MIFGKLWRALRAQVNKVANYFWTMDPIAQMQYEYDKAVEELKSGRTGLEQYRGLVERVSRQVKNHETKVRKLEGQDQVVPTSWRPRKRFSIRTRLAASQE